MKRIVGLSVLFIGASFLVGAQNTWVQKDSVNGPPKSACVGFTIGGIGYIGTGFDQFDYKRSMFAYNPFVDDWDKVESIGGEFATGYNRSSAVAFVIGSSAYVGTGQGDVPYFGDFWRYDQATNSWTQVANFGGSPRREAVGFAIGDFGYVGTGQDANGLTNDFYQYNPSTNVWSAIAPFPGTARRQAIGLAMGDQGYVGTGDDGMYRRDFYQYEPTTNTWIQKADFGGTARYGAAAFAIFPELYVGTGYDVGLDYTKDMWAYNYFDDSWSQIADFPASARANAVGITIGNIGYMGTGYDGSPQDDFYEYTPILGVNSIANRNCKIFPNPAKNEVSIETNLHGNLVLSVYDLSGRKVTEDRLSAAQFNVSNLPVGTYVIEIKNEFGERAIEYLVKS